MAFALRRALRVTFTLGAALAAGLAANSWAADSRAASDRIELAAELPALPVAAVGTVAKVVGQESRRGQPITLGSRIASGPGSGVKFALNDRSVVIIGPNSAISVEEFAADRVVLRLERGSFHLDSANPGSVYVVLPTATVTVRSAIVAGRIGPDSAEIGLLSAGRAEVAGFGGQSVRLDRIGDATRVLGLGAPSQPAQLSPQALQDMIGLTSQIAVR
ncbi:MAG: FecR domain-containing protein [Ferrovibrio sp.]|jgi:ferric-dicitrate binding protein FerR (iron transport regulator)|uniref:FecR domain-containing protein n=1 Tax=Ferrovibrio sp. TaxID=1917215 RepID=UPI00391D41A2